MPASPSAQTIASQRGRTARWTLVALLLFWSLARCSWQLYTSRAPPMPAWAGWRRSVGADPGQTTARSSAVIRPVLALPCSQHPGWGWNNAADPCLLAIPCAYALQRRGRPAAAAGGWGPAGGRRLSPRCCCSGAAAAGAQFGLATTCLALCSAYAAGFRFPWRCCCWRRPCRICPAELEESALLEAFGLAASALVLVPLLGPALASTAVLVFLFSWNEFPIALTC